MVYQLEQWKIQINKLMNQKYKIKIGYRSKFAILEKYNFWNCKFFIKKDIIKLFVEKK